LTTSIGRTAYIWDVETREQVAALRGHERPLSNAGFRGDGRAIITASLDQTARIWPVFSSTRELVEHSKRMVPRCLTLEQRANAHVSVEPPAWCIELEKWPYETQDWKRWLELKRANANPPMPTARQLPWPRGM
jgi:hypothetical protein